MDELGIPAGAYVTEIEMDSPAMGVGIQSGDVITKIGTTEILSFSDYKSVMSKSQPGDTAVVTVMRYAKGEYTEMNFELVLDKLQ
jgi:serine protease Do